MYIYSVINPTAFYFESLAILMFTPLHFDWSKLFFQSAEQINCFASPKKKNSFLFLLPLFFFYCSFKKNQNHQNPTKYTQWPNTDVLDNHHYFYLPKYFCNIAHMQLLSKKHSNTPSLGCSDHNITNIIFLDKSIHWFLQKQKHCRFSDLSCLLIMILMFILNYYCFALLEILFGWTNNFVPQIGSWVFFRKNPFQFQLIFTSGWTRNQLFPRF